MTPSAPDSPHAHAPSSFTWAAPAAAALFIAWIGFQLASPAAPTPAAIAPVAGRGDLSPEAAAQFNASQKIRLAQRADIGRARFPQAALAFDALSESPCVRMQLLVQGRDLALHDPREALAPSMVDDARKRCAALG